MPADSVTYREMVLYVATVLDPVKAHADAHDTWHRDVAERDAKYRRTNLYTRVALIATSAVGIIGIILRLAGK